MCDYFPVDQKPVPADRGDVPPKHSSTAFFKALGQALRAERERLQLSQEELCHRAGLDRTYLSGVERGVRSPNLRTLLRVADALGMRLSRLLLAAEALGDAQR